MRLFLVGVSFFILASAAAQAETKTFIVQNDDGYGIDRCLLTGASCGAAIARSYCRSHEFAEARSFRKLADADLTGTVSLQPTCRGACPEVVAIECTR